MRRFKAFTMAEAVLVMTILGIIATVMITTMKPAKFKDQGYEVLAKSIYGSLDTAVTQIMVDKTPYNSLKTIYEHGSTSNAFAMNETSNGGKFIILLKDYMTTARGTVPAACTGRSYDSYMLLKNGACIAVKSGNVSENNTWIPGEKFADGTLGTVAAGPYGMIFLDTNGDGEPNVVGKDQYYIPLTETGIVSGD